jgi:uncharacterized protein YhfF
MTDHALDAGRRAVPIIDDEIRLGQLLKLADLVASGSDARPLLETGGVTVNGETETRRGRRLHPGDIVAVASKEVVVTRAEAPPRTFELGDPGPMRDRLVAAALRGDKTATTSLVVFYELEKLPLPVAGETSVLVGSGGEALGRVEVTRVEVAALGEIGDDVARAEGEGFDSALDWRIGHENYWGAFLDAVREGIGDPGWDLDDRTLVVIEWFRVSPTSEGSRE